MLPEGWKKLSLAKLGTITSGGTPSRKNPLFWNGDIPWVTTAELAQAEIYSTTECITKLGMENSAAKLFPIDTILIAMYGQGKTRGTVAKLKCEATTNQACAAIFNLHCNSDFLYQNLSSRYHEIRGLSNGGSQDNLSLELIKNIEISLPPLAEQKKIAEILSTWDEAISVVDRQLENCRQQKKALMQKLLTGKKRLPGFSGEWRERKISEIASVNPENLANSTRNDYRFNYISLDDVTEGNLTGFTQQTFASAPSRARRIIQQGDVLVAMVRPNLKSHLLIRDKVEDFICSTGFCVIRPHEGVLSQYIYHQFFGDIVNAQIEGLITGSNYPAINSYDVENLMIPLPDDIQEQKAIVAVLDSYESSLNKLEAKRNLLVIEKKSLMQQLLTGKKRVAVEE